MTDQSEIQIGILKYVLLYAIFAGLWIMVSDPMVTMLVSEPDHILIANTIKGWFFVAVTSALFYGLMRRIVRRMQDNLAREKALQAEKLRALQLLDGIAEGSTDAIFAKDTQGRYLLFNRAAARFIGKTEAEVLGRDDTELFSPADARAVMAGDRKVMESNLTMTYEDSVATRSGRTIFQSTKGPLHDTDGNVIGLFGISRDITGMKVIEDALRRERDRNQRYLDTVQNIMLALDSEGRVSMINHYGCTLLGCRESELLGQNWFTTCLPQPEGIETVFPVFRQVMSGDIALVEAYENDVLCRDGSKRTVAWHNGFLKNEAGNIIGTLSSGEDITEHKRAEAQIHRLAYYDSLTELPNRTLLLDRLGMIVPIASRQHRHDALLLFNLDRFKNINDTSGQAIGDSLLKVVAKRLSGVLREGDVLARLSGDEFAILLPDLAHEVNAAAHQTMHVAEKIHFGLRDPLRLGEEQFVLTASIGIALFPIEESDTPLDILRRAQTALHRSKANGGGQTTLFEISIDEVAKQRFLIERDLRLAIPAGQLRLYLQPQVDPSGKIVGAEALVRWQHPERGLITPGMFIPIAEESDLIIELGHWVFGEVCKLIASEAVCGKPCRISVNISARQFRQPDFVAWVKNELIASGAEPMHLTLEVTEGVVIDNISSVIAKMNELTDMGIHFSLDDFGTGYSSLAYLKRLPIHELKIDKTFVQDAPSDPDDAALVETILAVAKLMRLKVVAEGVETAEQAEFLNQRGQVIHQGYLFGKPQPAAEFISLLTSKSKP
ncbi:MAG: EAL domain-containing protein [Sideroxyarcus sp.]|nr:EAL domain-containing protein [Sideroxyarcus sp.]